MNPFNESAISIINGFFEGSNLRFIRPHAYLIFLFGEARINVFNLGILIASDAIENVANIIKPFSVILRRSFAFVEAINKHI